MMEAKYIARKSIDSLPPNFGFKPGSWPEKVFLMRKACLVCGIEIKPSIYLSKGGSVQFPSRKAWEEKQTCSRSCAKKLKNPMHNESTRKSVSQTLKLMGHKPKIQGGNGRGLSKPQAMLLEKLGEGWKAEFVVATKLRSLGYPHHYKIDLANQERMIAIEVDGMSHTTLERKEQDRRKDLFLVSQGWLVLRLSNQKAIDLCLTCTSKDILLTLLTEN
ncbi:MAG: DUF559 domain-containing protein [Betaproteobacteria bacterium]|nr:DUF559 domain-containing protein [Betaproteobacteria bacterium]